jgi:hypothetical protein
VVDPLKKSELDLSVMMGDDKQRQQMTIAH